MKNRLVLLSLLLGIIIVSTLLIVQSSLHETPTATLYKHLAEPDEYQLNRLMYLAVTDKGYYYIMSDTPVSDEYLEMVIQGEPLPFSKCVNDLFVCKGKSVMLAHPKDWKKLN